MQYFACVEPQKRLALHLHAAVRGGITGSLFDAVVAATYYALWWPPHDDPVYAKEYPPIWDDQTGGYVDPDTGQLLPTWDQALDQLEEADADPAYVLSFGNQTDRQWFLPGTPRTDKRIGYLTKYLTKSIAETDSGDRASDPQREHRDRLVEEVRWLPCSPECANWLRFGVQPKNPDDDMTPGECERAAHHPDNLGHGGRRVLVSRQSTGKTLDKHRADRAAVVRAVLAEAGIETPDRQRYATSQTLEDAHPATTGNASTSKTPMASTHSTPPFGNPSSNASNDATSTTRPSELEEPATDHPQTIRQFGNRQRDGTGGVRWTSC